MSKLKDINVTCIDAKDEKLQSKLEFYGIQYCKENELSKVNENNARYVTISYKGHQVYKTYVTKINK